MVLQETERHPELEVASEEELEADTLEEVTETITKKEKTDPKDLTEATVPEEEE